MRTVEWGDLYNRQILLKNLGVVGQQKLSNSAVLVVGAGGLGCPALQYLVGAGIGTIFLFDSDIVELSNLHRQPLFGVEDVGKPKSEVAAKKLASQNPLVRIYPIVARFDQASALAYLPKVEIVLDCSDNFPTRYLVNDACVLLKKTLVYGAVSQYEGQISVFNHQNDLTQPAANYRDLYPMPTASAQIGSCAEQGVLGVVAGFVGCMQALECLKILAGIGTSLQNKLLIYDCLHHHTQTFYYQPKPQPINAIPNTVQDFLGYDYENFCACSTDSDAEIEYAEINALGVDKKICLVDVREPNEQPLLETFFDKKIPLSTLANHINELSLDAIPVFVCAQGKRSLKALSIYQSARPQSVAYSLKQGVQAILKNQSEQKPSE